MVKKTKKINAKVETEAYQKVLYWFFSYPNKEMSLNDLSEQLKISKTTAKKVVNGFVREGFLNIEDLGRIWRISCNQEHEYNIKRKIPYNLSWIYESVIINVIHDVVKNPISIILFGSYRKGDDTDKSDIDIAVEVLDDKDLVIKPLAALPHLGYRKNVQVNLHVFSRKKIDLNLFSNIANGIVLEGFLEVRP